MTAVDLRKRVAPLVAKLTDGIVALVEAHVTATRDRAIELARETLLRSAARSTGKGTTTSRRARSATGGSKARRAARAAERPALSSASAPAPSASAATTAASSAPAATIASSSTTPRASGTASSAAPPEARRPCGCGPRGRHRADCPDREQHAPAPRIAEEIGGGAKSATVRASAPFVPASAATKADRFARLEAAAAARRAAEAYG